MIFLFILIGLAIIFVPFVPAILEMIHSTDAEALKITPHILKDPRSSPELIFWHFAHLLQVDSLQDLEKRAEVTEPEVLNRAILAVPGGLVRKVPKEVPRMFSSHAIELQPKATYLSKVLSMSSIITGTENALNEVHARGDLTLGERSKVIWWASGENVMLENAVELTGKVQAKRAIIFKGNARFHHLDAIVIQTEKAPYLGPIDFAVADTKAPPRLVYNEHIEIKAGQKLEGDLIAKGDLTLSEDVRVIGNVKCHGKLTLKSGARISGNVVCEKNIEFKGRNWVGGSILCQKKVSFEGDCFIGSENQRVTISANQIQIRGSFLTHGTLRTWIRGDFIA